jgi:NAD(P)H-dependent flavin oxidoreductase YrpB (nitropropane dioxygenase family)
LRFLPGLASAVTREGGIGTIAAVGKGLIREIRKARQLTTGVIAVNIRSGLSNFSDLVQTSIKEKIDVILLCCKDNVNCFLRNLIQLLRFSGLKDTISSF